MAFAYKLVSQDMRTLNTIWTVGVPVEISPNKIGNTLCTDQVLHCYASPELAVFFNKIHSNIENPRLFKIECSEIIADDGTKQGCKKQTLLHECSLPKITTEQFIEIGIKCVLTLYKEKTFVKWANNWLIGKDRSKKAAADAAADAAAYAAAYAAAAADAAADAAAYAAAYAYADAADAAAAYAAAAAAAADAAAADAAAAAAVASFKIKKNLDINSIILNCLNKTIEE